jgi:hypothetical protein
MPGSAGPSTNDAPRIAAWQHREARNGFEVVFLHTDDEGYRIGTATLLPNGAAKESNLPTRGLHGPLVLKCELAGRGGGFGSVAKLVIS